MGIKISFSIKDLENLSGVKAHTIRIWEKRYKLLQPQRSDTNIRAYSHEDLLKILNIALLHDNGFKISKIAALDDIQLLARVRDLPGRESDFGQTVNAFKVSMLNFDQRLFDDTYQKLLGKLSFRDIFLKVFLKLLEDIGLLWVSKTITPVHEHFISTLVKQKLLITIERLQSQNINTSGIAVLFLPINEIHELGLLYLHLELIQKGFRSIYLGPSVPVDSLLDLQKIYKGIHFFSYFTVEPTVENSRKYLMDIHQKILSTRGEKLYLTGRNTRHLVSDILPSTIEVFRDLKTMTHWIQEKKFQNF
jgi:DNA-binding transcriptional MerR regulator